MNAPDTKNTQDANTEPEQGADGDPITGAPAPTVWPTLQATDAHALIDFLVEKVGFRKTAVYADGERVAHAELNWPEGGGVMLGSYQPDASEWSRKPGTLGAYVVTAQVDELYERVRRNGVEIIGELTDRDYGSREFSIRDPEGNLWSFGTYRGAPVS